MLPQDEDLNYRVESDQQDHDVDQEDLPGFASRLSDLERHCLADQVEPRKSVVQCEYQSHGIEGDDAWISHQVEGAVFRSRCKER